MHSIETISKLNNEAVIAANAQGSLDAGKFVAHEYAGLHLLQVKSFDTLQEANAFKQSVLESETSSFNRVEITSSTDY